MKIVPGPRLNGAQIPETGFAVNVVSRRRFRAEFTAVT
jgi:hypothetical protein